MTIYMMKCMTYMHRELVIHNNGAVIVTYTTLLQY